MIATRHRLPHSMTCRRDYVIVPSNQILTTQYNVGPTNQPAKPPSEGVTSLWRSDHRHSPNKHTQGRDLPLPLKRVAQRRKTKRVGHTAQLGESLHNQNRTHDGQEWPDLGHSLPTSQSGQE